MINIIALLLIWAGGGVYAAGFVSWCHPLRLWEAFLCGPLVFIWELNDLRLNRKDKK